MAELMLIIQLFIQRSFSNAATDASATSCFCSYTHTVFNCQLYPFPGHLEGVLFQSADCKEQTAGVFICSNRNLIFADGSKLSHVSCSIFDGKSKLAAEAEADPIVSFLRVVAAWILNSGNSELKDELVKESEAAKAKVQAFKNQSTQIQAGIDAYRKATGSDPQVEEKPSSSESTQ